MAIAQIAITSEPHGIRVHTPSVSIVKCVHFYVIPACSSGLVARPHPSGEISSMEKECVWVHCCQSDPLSFDCMPCGPLEDHRSSERRRTRVSPHGDQRDRAALE